MVIDKKTFTEKFKERVLATKKINLRDESVVTKTLEEIYDVLSMFNSMPEFTTSIEGRMLSEIVIANEWKDFILPEAVRLDPTDLKTANLLDKKEGKRKFGPEDYLKFINNQLRFRSWFKRDLSDGVTNLATLRSAKSLYDVIPVMMVNIEGENMIRSLDDPFIPIKLKSEVGCLFRTDYYNTKLDQIISDYFSKASFT